MRDVDKNALSVMERRGENVVRGEECMKFGAEHVRQMESKVHILEKQEIVPTKEELLTGKNTSLPIQM